MLCGRSREYNADAVTASRSLPALCVFLSVPSRASFFETALSPSSTDMSESTSSVSSSFCGCPGRQQAGYVVCVSARESESAGAAKRSSRGGNGHESRNDSGSNSVASQVRHNVRFAPSASPSAGPP